MYALVLVQFDALVTNLWDRIRGRSVVLLVGLCVLSMYTAATCWISSAYVHPRASDSAHSPLPALLSFCTDSRQAYTHSDTHSRPAPIMSHCLVCFKCTNKYHPKPLIADNRQRYHWRPIRYGSQQIEL